MKRICSALVVCIFAVFIAAGCDSKPAEKDTEKKRPLVGVFLYKGDDVYISLVGEHLNRLLGEKADVEIFSADYDQFTQNEQVDALIAKKADALVVNLVEIQNAAQLVDKVKQAGIPVVFFNREPDLSILKSYPDMVSFVGTIPEDAGRLQGDIIAKLWNNHPEFDRNKDGKFQYVLFQGNADNPEAIARSEFSVRQAVENGVGMEQLGQTYLCAWDRALAQRSMELAFAHFGDNIELILSNNDAMALGAIDIIQRAGYNLKGGDKFIPVIGVDAIPDAIAAINDGTMSATVVQDAEGMAKAITALALNKVAGKPFLDGTSYSFGEHGVEVRIPYSAFGGE